MGFLESTKSFFLKAFDYKGRASRPEFWYAILFTVLVGAAAGILDIATRSKVVSGLANLCLFLPLLSLQVRRLHDTNRTGWWIALTPACVVIFFISTKILITQSAMGYDGRVGKTVNPSMVDSYVTALFAMIAFLFIVNTYLFVCFCLRSDSGSNRYDPVDETARYRQHLAA